MYTWYRDYGMHFSHLSLHKTHIYIYISDTGEKSVVYTRLVDKEDEVKFSFGRVSEIVYSGTIQLYHQGDGQVRR